MLSISPETVCYLIVKAREFDLKLPPAGADDGDEPEGDVLADRADDPTYLEMVETLDALTAGERRDLIALMLLGRGEAGDLDEGLEQADEVDSEGWQSFLLGTPLLGDFLEEGLAALDIACADYEIGRI